MNIENDDIGFLIVNVKTANGALPVENATVTIYDSSAFNDNGAVAFQDSDVIYTLKTDKNGKTEKVALNTLDKALSMTPGAEKAYKGYNILVTKDGFYDSSYYNVPLFSSIVSLQSAYLIPLSEYATPDDVVPNSSRTYLEYQDL